MGIAAGANDVNALGAFSEGFDDLIGVYVRMSRIGRTSATYELAAYRERDDLLLVTATQTLVLVDLDERKAVPIPDSYKEAIHAFEGEAVET